MYGIALFIALMVLLVIVAHKAGQYLIQRQMTKEQKGCNKQGDDARFCSIEKGGCEICTLPRNRKDMVLNRNQQQAYDIYKECHSQYVQSPDNQEKARAYYKAQQEWLNAARQRGIYKTSEENPITTEKNGKE